MQSNETKTDHTIQDNRLADNREFNNTARNLLVLSFPITLIIKKVFLLGLSPFQAFAPDFSWLNIIFVIAAGALASKGLTCIFDEEKPDKNNKEYKFYKFIKHPAMTMVFMSFLVFSPVHAAIIVTGTTIALAILGAILSRNM